MGNRSLQKAFDADKFWAFLTEKFPKNRVHIPRAFEALDKLVKHGFSRKQQKGILMKKCKLPDVEITVDTSTDSYVIIDVPQSLLLEVHNTFPNQKVPQLISECCNLHNPIGKFK